MVITEGKRGKMRVRAKKKKENLYAFYFPSNIFMQTKCCINRHKICCNNFFSSQICIRRKIKVIHKIVKMPIKFVEKNEHMIKMHTDKLKYQIMTNNVSKHFMLLIKEEVALHKISAALIENVAQHILAIQQ